MSDPDWITAIATVVAAGAAVIAIAISIVALFGSKRVYRQTKKFFWTQQINDMVDRFYTPEVLRAERDLRNWQARYKGEFATKFAKVRDDYKGGKLKDDELKKFADLDMGRRLVESYFLRIHQLKMNGPVKDEDIKLYVYGHQVEALLGILLPMNRAITGKVEDKKYFHPPFKSMYCYYATQYSDAKEKALERLTKDGVVINEEKIDTIEDLIGSPCTEI